MEERERKRMKGGGYNLIPSLLISLLVPTVHAYLLKLHRSVVVVFSLVIFLLLELPTYPFTPCIVHSSGSSGSSGFDDDNDDDQYQHQYH